MSSEESTEQLACLDALSLLDASGQSELVESIERSAALSAFRRDMVETVSQLAWLAPACEPPARLRTRILTATQASGQAPL